MKKNSPDGVEAILSKHKDILLRLFGTVNIDLDQADELMTWVFDHKQELGKRYYIIRDWAEDVWCEVATITPSKPQKKYYCRYCQRDVLRADVAVTGDDVIVCKECAYGLI